MALTVCLKCDRCYGETKAECPHCGAHNFFADDDTLLPAVHVLCEQVEHEHKTGKRAKLAELAEVREEILPHTRPWWKVYKDEIYVALIVVGIFVIWLATKYEWLSILD